MPDVNDKGEASNDMASALKREERARWMEGIAENEGTLSGVKVMRMEPRDV